MFATGQLHTASIVRTNFRQKDTRKNVCEIKKEKRKQVRTEKNKENNNYERK
jgi:hypothetical protein